jgi:hypothetical protein
MLNPSEINIQSLPWVPLDATAGFPKKPGIYFAIDSQGQIQYMDERKTLGDAGRITTALRTWKRSEG